LEAPVKVNHKNGIGTPEKNSNGAIRTEVIGTREGQVIMLGGVREGLVRTGLSVELLQEGVRPQIPSELRVELLKGEVRPQIRRTATAVARQDHRAFNVIIVGLEDMSEETVGEGNENI
jgi:hypothetical protein